MKITLEEHREYGKRFKSIMYEVLFPISTRIISEYGKSSRKFKAVEKTIHQILLLKNELDKIVCSDYPDSLEVERIYFGTKE